VKQDPTTFVRPLRIPESIPISLAEPSTATLGERGQWRFSFVLTEDIPPGAPLSLVFSASRNVVGEFSHLQVTDPDEIGYVSIARETGEPIHPIAAETDNRQVALAVPEGGLHKGERLHAHLGSIAGHEMYYDYFALPNKMVLLCRPRVPEDDDNGGTNIGPKLTIVGACLVHFVANQIESIRIHAPATVRSKDAFAILVRPEDRYRNPAISEPGSLVLRLNGQEIEAERETVAGTTCVKLSGIVLREPGVYRFEVEDTSNGFTGVSNPVEALARDSEEPDVYWGYIHGHTEASDGIGTMDQYFAYMRDTSLLDFGALGDHAHEFETSEEMWKLAQEATTRHNDPGTFVTLLGHEWGMWRKNGDGDRNVYFLDGDRPLYRSDDNAYPTVPELFDALRRNRERAMVIPHHSASAENHCDYKDHDPDLERLVELYSEWGNSERRLSEGSTIPMRPGHPATPDRPFDAGEHPDGYIQRALAMGWRVGFTGGGDDHCALPGDYRQKYHGKWRRTKGLFSVEATQKTRQAIWESLYERRCVATTCARIIVRFRVAGRLLGSELSIAQDPSLAQRRVVTARVHGTAPIERIEVVRNNEDVFVHEGTGLDEVFEWTDSEEFGSVALPPARYSPEPFCFYYLRVTQTDGELAWTSPVWIVP